MSDIDDALEDVDLDTYAEPTRSEASIRRLLTLRTAKMLRACRDRSVSLAECQVMAEKLAFVVSDARSASPGPRPVSELAKQALDRLILLRRVRESRLSIPSDADLALIDSETA